MSARSSLFTETCICQNSSNSTSKSEYFNLCYFLSPKGGKKKSFEVNLVTCTLQFLGCSDGQLLKCIKSRLMNSERNG